MHFDSRQNALPNQHCSLPPRIRSSSQAGTPIPLIFRIATVEDVKPSERVPSRRLWLSAGGGQQRGGGRQRGGRRQQQQEQWQEGGEEGEGGEYQERGRGRRRYKVRRGGRPAGWQHDDRGEEGEGGEGQGGGQEWGDLDAVIQQQRQQGGEGGGGGRRQRRPRNKRQRRDVDMADAEGGGMQVCVGAQGLNVDSLAGVGRGAV